jgi:hypothetical protein
VQEKVKCFALPYVSPGMPLQHAPFWLQHPPTSSQALRASDPECSLTFDIVPAPPLISLFTLPPHSGQTAIGGSDIFWRRSKWQLQAAHSYS